MRRCPEAVSYTHLDVYKRQLYHYFKNKEELFYELTDSAADGLKRMILRFRSMRFDLNMDAQEFRMLLTEEVLSLLLAEKYGLLLIMEQANGTRYENLRPVMIELIASKIVPMLADEENPSCWDSACCFPTNRCSSFRYRFPSRPSISLSDMP